MTSNTTNTDKVQINIIYKRSSKIDDLRKPKDQKDKTLYYIIKIKGKPTTDFEYSLDQTSQLLTSGKYFLP